MNNNKKLPVFLLVSGVIPTLCLISKSNKGQALSFLYYGETWLYLVS
jgi:hypothetical protein